METFTDYGTAYKDGVVRKLLVHDDKSISERLRRRRWSQIFAHVPNLAELRVLDLGGTGPWWANAPVLPRHVTAVNLYDANFVHPSVTMIEGDALEADELVGGQTFDLVFSNSLLEHLGGHSARRRFAELARSLAPRYVIQTPYRYFPVEPHWMFPGFQFLPVRARGYLAPRWPLGHTHGYEPRVALNEVMATDLLSAAEMKEYFPDSHVVYERIGGVPKSMIAIR
jgi:hypothetical protein